MDFQVTTTQQELLDVVSRAATGLGRKGLPMYDNIRLNADSNGMLTATANREAASLLASSNIPATGSILVGSNFAKTLKKLPAGPMIVEASTDTGLHILCDTGTELDMTLPYQDTQFPALEVKNGQSVKFTAGHFIDLLDSVINCASKDESRPVLTGVLFQQDDVGFRMVSTDSYRLGLVRVNANLNLPGNGLLIKAANLQLINKIVGRAAKSRQQDLLINTDSEGLTVSYGNSQVTYKTIDGTFPMYEQLLPDSHYWQVKVDAKELVDTISRLEMIAEDHIPIRIDLQPNNRQLVLHCKRIDVGNIKEPIVADSVTIDTDGNDELADGFTVAYNPFYLKQGIMACKSDSVIIQGISQLKPAWIQPADSSSDSFGYLLMPVRL